ncbi:MAG: hypothetical protein RL685_4630 [Pseudomonadota bacterium]|jgi:hypothetical protein
MTQFFASLSLGAALLSLTVAPPILAADTVVVTSASTTTDGVFQGLGALQVLGSFVLPETQALALRNSDGSPALAVSVAPAHLGRGANGVMAVGRF